MTQETVIDVRGSKVRCSGSAGHPHRDLIVEVPAGRTVCCPLCGCRYRRATLWNLLSGAIWPPSH